MKKYIILILTVFLMSGCTATVNLNIELDKITENITIFAKDQSEYNKASNWNGFPLPLYYDQELSNPFSDTREKEAGVSYYDVSFDETNKKINLNGEFDFDNHKRSSIIRNCFKYYEIRQYDNNYIFSTSSGLICDYSNIEVVVQTPYKVTMHNSEKVDTTNNTYTWIINDSNKEEINLYFEIDSSQKVLNDNKDNVDSSGSEISKSINVVVLIIIVLIIFVFIIIGYFILRKRKKELSKI
ncbi:MAG: hypothetical protein ACI31R_02880 [Bacilli bacterium]